MAPLRLLADDLTGALDAAAQFTAAGRSIPVFASQRMPGRIPEGFAVDLGTRECGPDEAHQRAGRLAALLAPDAARISFLKIDSLLRGHPAVELASVWRSLGAERCIVAPAFPFQGRVTRGGIQFAKAGAGWEPVGGDLRESLARLGLACASCRAGDPVPRGISLWDAATDDDLRLVASVGRSLSGPTLWCGTAGLAAALSGAAAPSVRRFDRPLLGLVGTDHPVTAAQLHASGEAVVKADAFDARIWAAAAHQMDSTGICLVHFSPPAGMSRRAAAPWIARGVSGLAASVRVPASVLVTGGETLDALCVAVGAECLCVTGQALPGVPISVVVGGRWDGVRVISKSGAFGDAQLVRWLLAAHSY